MTGLVIFVLAILVFFTVYVVKFLLALKKIKPSFSRSIVITHTVIMYVFMVVLLIFPLLEVIF